MGIDWAEIERLVKPAPNYGTLVKRNLQILSYDFVRKYYNHSMNQAKNYTTRLLGAYPGGIGEYKKLNKAFKQLDSLGVKNYLEFMHHVETKEKLEKFHSEAGLSIQEIIRAIKCLFYWILPSKKYLRELIDADNQKHLKYVTTLRENGLRFTLDILEKGRTKEGRQRIAKETGIPEDFIYDLANRADFTRMPFISGKTVKHYFCGGYNSLEKLASADLDELTEDMAKYLSSIGMKLRRSFIELESNIAIAKILPKIIES
jgi:hypothetical protein